MKVIIAGSRSVVDIAEVNAAMRLFLFEPTEIVSGRARGVDLLGERWAKEHNVPIAAFPADWNKYGKSAGYIRNAEMGAYSDALVAVWDGYSRGTKHMIDHMNKLGKIVQIYRAGQIDDEFSVCGQCDSALLSSGKCHACDEE